MKYLLMTCLALALVPSTSRSQQVVSQSRPFRISSLNSGFGLRGEFEGEFRIYPDRIKLKITKAEIIDSKDCPYQGRRLVSALRFDLGKSLGEKRWDILHAGQDFFMEEVMNPGDKISFHDLYFDILINDSIDLSKHWIVVSIEDTALDVPEQRVRKGYNFAHSECDIFAGYVAKLP